MSSGRHPHSVHVHPGRRVGSKIGRDGRERRHSDQRHNKGTCDCLVKRATISNSSSGIRRVDWPMASASPGRPCSPEDKRCSRLSGQALPRSGSEGGLQKPSSASTCNVCVHVGDRRPASLGGKHWRPWHQAVTALVALKHFNHAGGDVSVGHATGPLRLICPASLHPSAGLPAVGQPGRIVAEAAGVVGQWAGGPDGCHSATLDSPSLRSFQAGVDHTSSLGIILAVALYRKATGSTSTRSPVAFLFPKTRPIYSPGRSSIARRLLAQRSPRLWLPPCQIIKCGPQEHVQRS